MHPKGHYHTSIRKGKRQPNEILEAKTYVPDGGSRPASTDEVPDQDIHCPGPGNAIPFLGVEHGLRKQVRRPRSAREVLSTHKRNPNRIPGGIIPSSPCPPAILRRMTPSRGPSTTPPPRPKGPLSLTLYAHSRFSHRARSSSNPHLTPRTTPLCTRASLLVDMRISIRQR
ncbi:hypothetical protein FA13DRAFT_1317082 [Coprinellus micaceus]|uniref:Uncharacterized protein n=1 Tax=Coprinellus micaceus TaxID=71717 RepID=A0A4Y7SSZ4_COPMI|nr:hypothetical protein FA13DRAFT_1317082 [Coprinellus micaceus]